MAGKVTIAQASAATLKKRIEGRRVLMEAAIAANDYKTADVHKRMLTLYQMQLDKVRGKVKEPPT